MVSVERNKSECVQAVPKSEKSVTDTPNVMEEMMLFQEVKDRAKDLEDRVKSTQDHAKTTNKG